MGVNLYLGTFSHSIANLSTKIPLLMRGIDTERVPFGKMKGAQDIAYAHNFVRYSISFGETRAVQDTTVTELGAP